MLAVAWALVLGCATASAQSSGEPVGRIKVSAGTASVVRAGRIIEATVGTDVFESDELRTGHDGRIGLILRDDTRLALGANSGLALTQFAFAPEAGRLALSLQLLRGALSYVSGVIAKLAPAAVRIQTPSSIIGVRGTHVLVNATAAP